MSDIQRAIELYTLMAQRCEATGVSDYQAAVYREMINFMGDCKTISEATQKIKNSKYFLAPSVALMKDRMTSLKIAAQENGIPELADVYQAKLDEIEADIGAIYETGYEQAAQNVKIRYAKAIEAFCNAYNSYLTLCCSAANDTDAINSAKKDLNEAFEVFALLNKDFSVLASDPFMRKLIPANDEGYARFVREAPQIRASGIEYREELDKIAEQARSEWETMSKQKDSIRQTGKKNLEKVRKSRVTVVSPNVPDGKYSYIDEEVR